MIILLLLFLLMSISAEASQTSAHQAGTNFGSTHLDQVKGLAQSPILKDVPGYQTDKPSEASLDSLSLSEEAISRSKENPAAQYILAQARERQSFKIDPSTDPLFQGTAEITADPHKALQDDLVEIIPTDTQEDEILTCDESGVEYAQKCTNRLVIELRITPESKTYVRKCNGHRESRALGTKHVFRYRNNCNCGSYWNVIPKKVDVLREEWENGCRVPDALVEQGLCTYVGKTTSTQNETRTIQGEPIIRPHFEEHYEYSCLKVALRSCAGLREKGCYQIKSACKEKQAGQCILWEQTYRCPSGKQTLKRYQTTNPKSPFCLSGDCADSSYQANGELLTVMSQMATLREIQQDLRQFNIIFKGEDRRCTRNCVNFKDCCTNGKGWGVSLKLSSCSKEEEELGELRDKKRCVLVGTYCAEKEKITGLCLRKKTSFCCFGTQLARLLQQFGRDQLSIGWGSAEHPDCSGLTPEQLSKIDLSKIDFSEVFSQIQENMTVKNAHQSLAQVSTERLQENMTALAKPTLNPNKSQELFEKGL